MTAAGEGEGAARPRKSNLQLRIASALILGAVAIAALWAGGFVFRLSCAAVGVLVFFEWASTTRAATKPLAQAMAALLLAVVFIHLLIGSPYLGTAVLICLAALLAVAVFWERSGWTVAGFLYALAATLPLALLRDYSPRGIVSVLVLFAVVWGTDILAYFVGRAIGGPKLAPAISPGKTWSGAIGGAVAGVVLGLAVAALAGMRVDASLAVLLLVLSVASQCGDLFESWVKRHFGVKDSGWIIPGHGGVMDRVDGLIVASLVLFAAVFLPAGLLAMAG